MKRHHTFSSVTVILLLLVCVAFGESAIAQTLPTQTCVEIHKGV